MTPSLALIVAVVSLVLPTIHASMTVRLYTGLNRDDDKWKYEFSTTQRCFTFGKCLDGVTMGADWNDVDDGYAIVFYSEDQCQGKTVESKAVPKGQVVFDYDSASIGAKSFMVWEQGMYATRGFTAECLERAAVNSSQSPQLEVDMPLLS
ncbi:hypothetical protein PHYBOEH_008859 [Phytophthora boehmeriae]|uniref:Uncharacterized protein n=1 Tax=Phytophthora boehmeriae TaxID=109152 RepID=A0A8T1VYA5_9STRA|nr:hypothetical protein PHYBOEH_008859 [Phytophthora boehmeriae]